ncbi:MAG: arginine repressor [Oscillospiraceae bacterium]|nr:arginine repressor [Oscillospiraceae bacterium]
MKTERQEKILELIRAQDIVTQNDLAAALHAAGISGTQATISRDMRELGLTKEQGPEGGYRYVAPRQNTTQDHIDRLRTIFKESVTSVDVAQNLLVVKTLPGLASAACSAIDSMGYPGLIGTLAGDDTAFLAMADNAVAERFRMEIAGML